MKQKRDRRFIVLGVVFLFFIAGCERGGDGGGVGGVPRDPFLGGTQGLEISFEEGSPPEEVTDGGEYPFQAVVRLKNVGEYGIKEKNAKVNLIGFSPTDFDSEFSKLKVVVADALTARQRDSEGNIIEPVEVFVTFPTTGEFNFKNPIAGNTPFIFRADVCYKYQTKVVSEICILKNVGDDAICEPSAPKRVFSSGSPLQVTSFRQIPGGKDKVRFSFDMMHSGSGDIFDGTTPAVCQKDVRGAKEKVEVRVKTGISGSLDCVGLDNQIVSDGVVEDIGDGVVEDIGLVKLIDGRRTITCTQDISSVQNDLKKVVDIILDFNYLDNVDRVVLVKHLIKDP